MKKISRKMIEEVVRKALKENAGSVQGVKVSRRNPGETEGLSDSKVYFKLQPNGFLRIGVLREPNYTQTFLTAEGVKELIAGLQNVLPNVK